MLKILYFINKPLKCIICKVTYVQYMHTYDNTVSQKNEHFIKEERTNLKFELV